MSIDFGLGLLPGPPAGKLSQWLDDLNASLPHLQGHFRSLWMTDHFFWDGEPTYEVWTVLSYLAAHFPAYEVGPMVLGQSYRNPALLALMGATLQTVSGGRFVMGIGAGWKEDEYRAYDYPYPTPGVRLEQLEDALEIIKRLWTQPGQVSYSGRHYSVTNAWCEPKPDPVPPIVVGGGGRKTMLLAARHADMWNLSDANIRDYTAKVQVLHEHCAAIGRDPSTLRLTWFGRMAVGATPQEAARWAASRPQNYTPDNAFVGTPQQIIEQMRPFIELGVDYFMVDVIGLPDPDVIRLVLEEVLPEVRA